MGARGDAIGGVGVTTGVAVMMFAIGRMTVGKLVSAKARFGVGLGKLWCALVALQAMSRQTIHNQRR